MSLSENSQETGISAFGKTFLVAFIPYPSFKLHLSVWTVRQLHLAR